MDFKELFPSFIAMTPIKRKGWGGYWKYDPRTNSVNIFTKDGNVVNFRDESCDWSFTLANILEDDWEIATNENTFIKGKTLKEDLSNLAHEQWSGWMKYLFEKSTKNEDGTVTIPKWAVDRWERQINTPYGELSEEEQNSDRKEADKFLKVIRYHKEKNLI